MWKYSTSGAICGPRVIILSTIAKFKDTSHSNINANKIVTVILIIMVMLMARIIPVIPLKIVPLKVLILYLQNIKNKK